MAKLYLDEIETALSFQGVENLVKDVDDSKKISSSLESFIDNSSSKLEGAQWDAVRSKVGEYKNAMEIRSNVASSLYDSIKQALNMLKSYMGEYIMLDSSQLNDCYSQKSSCESTISSLKSKLSTATNTSSIRSQIESAEKTLEELEKLIKKLEGLDEVYQSALGILENGYQEVVNFSSKASIKSSGKFVYSK